MNVLFVTADQWRGDCLSCLGHPAVRTPNLDRLAADGVLFARHFAQATPCGPSRASLHTGLYALNHRSITNGTPLDARHKTLASLVRAAGYDPVLFGYTDTSADPRAVPADSPWLRTYEGVAPGFRVELRLPEAEEAWFDHLAARGYGRRTYEEVYGGSFHRPAPYRAEDSVTAFLADRFLGWLDRQDKRPWFAHVSFIKPHPPFVAPEPWYGSVAPERRPSARARRDARGRRLGASLAGGASGHAGAGPRPAQAAGRRQPRPVARGLLRPDRRGRPSSRPDPGSPGKARRARPDTGRDHFRPWRDAGRPLDAGQGRLLPAGVPRAAADSATPGRTRPAGHCLHRACRPDADDPGNLGVAGAAPVRRVLAVGFPYSRTATFMA